jgi:circadian clock protein KaiB
LRAIASVHSICDKYLAGRVDLRVIDVCKDPELAPANQTIAVPTLIKEAPPPRKSVVGDFSDTKTVLRALEIFEHSIAI